MKDRLITEEDYRETLNSFIGILADEEPYSEKELNELIRLLETYEYENC
jgi:hypothetical protein